jgi:hypothetical protein
MIRVTHAEQQQIARNVIYQIALEQFRRLEYAEGRDYAILDLRQKEREALAAHQPIRQSAYCALLKNIE